MSGLPKPRSMTSAPARRASTFRPLMIVKTYGGRLVMRRKSTRPAYFGAPTQRRHNAGSGPGPTGARLTRVTSCRSCPSSSPTIASTSSSRSPAAAATSTRSTTTPGGCSSTGGCSPPPPIPPTTGSSRTRSAATAIRSTRSCCWRTRCTRACGCRPAPSACCTWSTRPATTPRSSASRPTSRASQDIHDIADLTPQLVNEIQHFFEVYKALEPGKSSSTSGLAGRSAAWQEIEESRTRFVAHGH